MFLKSLLKSVLYILYTRRLLKQVQQGPLPRHVALILDGNRRFALQRGIESPQLGHQMGAEKLDELLTWCDELAIPVVTVWALSLDNLNRHPDELSTLVEVIENKVSVLAQTQGRQRSPRSIHALGQMDVLPDSLQNAITVAETRTAHLGPLRLNIAIGYDGREEITQAVRSLLMEHAEKEASLSDVASNLTSEEIERWIHRSGNTDPDLIIRTSGELRLSGFMLWQSAHSELYFCDTLWPAFRKVDFLRALRSYQHRERRYGK
jgi:short-chain Z-isoprenyl diphosphate synthase